MARNAFMLRLASPMALIAAVAAADLVVPLPPALAQTAQQAAEPGVANANYLPPFPEGDTWRALVIGDMLGEGLLGGLVDAFSGESKIQFTRKHRPINSLVRNDIEDDMRGLEEAITKERVHIAIVMLGTNDRGGIRTKSGRRAIIGSDEWKTEYGARIDRILKTLRRRQIAVYWVGLPTMRRPELNDENEAMNDVYREKASANGARFIDVFAGTSDEGGQYTDRGPDVSGKPVRLRESDGISFTPQGYRKLAFFLERDLKRDMTTARNERVVPLAGNEDEQRKVNPAGSAAAAAAAGQTAAQAKGGKAASPTARTTPQGLAAGQPSPAEPPGSDRRADNTRVAFRTLSANGREEQVTVDILRPALAGSVIAAVTRRDSGDKASPVGDTVTDTLSNGLMVMRSVTPTSDGGQRSSRGVPTQQPYFRALVKGERLQPKPGRADDFRWPREDDLPPPPEPEAARAGAAITSPVQLKQPPKGAPRLPGQRS